MLRQSTAKPPKTKIISHKKTLNVCSTTRRSARRGMSSRASRQPLFTQDILGSKLSKGDRLTEAAAFVPTHLRYQQGPDEDFEQLQREFQRNPQLQSQQQYPLHSQQQQHQHQQQHQQQQHQQPPQNSQQRMKKSLFGDLDLAKSIAEDKSFLKDPLRPDGKHLLAGTGQLKDRPPTKLKLNKKAIDKERIDLSGLEVQPYIENLKGAIIHHDLEQLLASISGIVKFGDRVDLFDPRVDSEETILEKITTNNEKHRKEYRILLDNVKAVAEVILYDLELVSERLNVNSNLNKLHCTLNTLQHLFSVYRIIPIPINDPNLKVEHCSIDSVAEQLVKRSEVLDIQENGLEVYQQRNEHPPIPIISPLIGAIYMMILSRYGYTAGIVHTPMVGLVFATPPISRSGIQDPDILARTQQSSPYWYIKNLVTDHGQQYRKTGLKLTPVDCKSFCTPSIGAGRTPEELATDFTCSCLTQNDAGYGGNFMYIDFLVNKIGQIPYTYTPRNKLEALVNHDIELSTDSSHSIQMPLNWELPYPIYSYKTLAMRLAYEPIFAGNIGHQLGTTLELASAHLSSHIDNDPWRPKIKKVKYEEFMPSSDDGLDEDGIDEAADFENFLKDHQTYQKQ